MKIAVKLDAKHKIIIIAVASAGLILSIIYFAVLPLMGKIIIAKNKLAQEDFRVSNLMEEGKKVEEYRKLKEKMETNRKKIDEAVVRSGSEIDLIKKIEEVALALGIKTEIQAYVPPKKKKNVAAVEDQKEELNSAAEKTSQPNESKPADSEEKNANYFLITSYGDYQQFLHLLYRMENLNYIVKIESVKLNALDEFALEKLKSKTQITGNPTLKSEIIISYIVQ